MSFPIVHNLFYTWAGWPSGSLFPPKPSIHFFDSLCKNWRNDHLDLQACVWKPEQIQMTFKVAAEVAPIFFTARVKGRLQHAMRQAGIAAGFTRKVVMRALGDNCSDDVEGCLRKQTIRVELLDERYRATLREAGIEEKTVDLSQPSEVRHGRYWYNLHLVAVTEDRYRMGREDFLYKVRDGTLAWAGETKCRLKALALMPDHIHIAVRGNVEQSPLALAESLWGELNHSAGCRLMSDKVYAGTFSEYKVKVVFQN